MSIIITTPVSENDEIINAYNTNILCFDFLSRIKTSYIKAKESTNENIGASVYNPELRYKPIPKAISSWVRKHNPQKPGNERNPPHSTVTVIFGCRTGITAIKNHRTEDKTEV